MIEFNYPKVVLKKDNAVYLDIKISGKRMRISNGSKFNINLSPNTYPIKERINQANILAAQIIASFCLGMIHFMLKLQIRFKGFLTWRFWKRR